MTAPADEPVDVLVVGAGAAGSMVSLIMARAGFAVTCLEQGGWVRPENYGGARPERDLLHATTWHVNPNVRRGEGDYPVEVTDAAIHPVMYNAVGGGTVHYGAEWTRMLPSDFRLRTLDGVADDWPITYWDLEPYYDRIEDLMGVSSLPGDPAYPPMTPSPSSALPIGPVGARAADAFNKLGWHWWPGYNAISGTRHRHQDPCKRRGVCALGCPEGAKATVDQTIWPDALEAGARLITHARVRRVTTDAAGLATGAEWVDRDGTVHQQAARVVVLACNGVGTSRLLLLSASARHPDGLANSTGLVGKRLQMHEYGLVHGLYDDDLDSTLGPFGNIIGSSEFAERDSSRGFWGGARFGVYPVPGPVQTWWRTDDLPISQRIGANLHDIVDMTGRAFEIGFSMDDLPDEGNRVTLDSSLTDDFGIPAPKVAWKPRPDAGQAISWFAERAEEIHHAAGARSVRRMDVGKDVGWHMLGTARMGTDPQTSVTDPYGRAHDVPNLFIVDGSVFVTSGQTNPTATVMAFALRSAEHMVQHAATQPIP